MRTINEINKELLIKSIDQSLLKITTTTSDVRTEAKKTLEFGFRAFVVHPCNLKLAKSILKDSEVLLASVSDFPHGRSILNSRTSEVKEIITLGADEIDIVSSYQLLLDNDFNDYRNDLSEISKITSENNKTLKIILEVDLLTGELITTATEIISEIAVKNNIENKIIIKTKTGYAERKLENIDAVKLIKGSLDKNKLSDKILIKASGGIKTKEDCITLIQAGASILGTSSGVEIIS